MFLEICKDLKSVEFVLNNLSEETLDEMIFSFGVDFKKTLLPIINSTNEKYLIRLKENKKPVGVFGLVEESENVAGIFFLTTQEVYEGNMIKLLRTSKEVVNKWLDDYKLILDDCDINNEKIKRWLLMLGFKPTKIIKQERFQTYYLGDTKYLAEVSNEY